MLLTSTAYASEGGTELTADVSEYVNNEVLVMYKDGGIDVISYDDDLSLSEGLSELAQDENVLLYQPNYTYESNGLSVSDPYVSEQWALYNDGSFYMEEEQNRFPVYNDPYGSAVMPGQWTMPDNFGRPGGAMRRFSYGGTAETVNAVEGIDINIGEAWQNYTDSGREVVVAVVDTGIDYTHEDLVGRIWTNTDEIPGNGIDDDSNGYIDDVYGWNFYSGSNEVYEGSEDDHGTHNAGTIAAVADNGKGIAGITQSDNIKVMSVKALGGGDGSGSTASVIRAIQYAEANGASICNLSLGSSQNDAALYNAIANSNMLFVVAAGNDGSDNDAVPSYPASYDLENIITVANLNYNGTLEYSSNYGAESVDIAAPGSYILSTTTDGGYSYMSGTSMAAPMVSGAAAMVYSNYPDISPADVKEILLSSAKKLDTLEGEVSTGGMLDVGSAMTYDLTTLSGEEWEVKTPEAYKGSAPVIKAYLAWQYQEQCLMLQVYDEDGDAVYAAYAEGERDADYFSSGGAQTEIELSDNGTAILAASAGTFTFYAVDACGNGSVYTVRLEERTQPVRISPTRYVFGRLFGRGY